MKFSELKGAVSQNSSKFKQWILPPNCVKQKNNRSKKYKIQEKSRMDKLHLLLLKAC